MKILAFTDMHGSPKAFQKIKQKSKNADIIICCGDITIFENDLKKIIKRFDSLGKTMLIIPGNHEFPEELEALCKKTKNLHYIEKSYYETDEFIFLGAEGNGFSIEDKTFRKTAKKFRKIIDKNKSKKHILITHAPPFGTRHDLLIDEHCGNKEIKDFIIKAQPAYAFCGHIHENSYTKDTIRKTITMNPGPEGRLIKIQNN